MGSAIIVLVLMNQPPGWPFNWDAADAIAAQPANARASGRTGVIVVALLQPTRFEPSFTINFIDKLLANSIPWPINKLAGRDSGVALIDPDRPDEQQPFTPRTLMAFDGRTHDWDGESYAAKHARGLVTFAAPSGSTAGDIGSFRYEGRAGGAPGPAQRAMLKARAIYYARLPGQALPQKEQTEAMVAAAFDQLRRQRSVKASVLYDIFNPHDSRRQIIRMLDAGVDSLVLASALPINSGFEEYDGAYPKLYKLVKEWSEKRGKPMPRLIFAPQLADMPGYRAVWARHLADSAPPPANPDASATLVVSLHGLPVIQQQSDPWVDNARRVGRAIAPELAAALRQRGWRRITTVVAQEAFGDAIEDPGDKLLSVAEVFAQARARKDQLAIAVPVEFLSENTDTLFLHSYLMFDGLPGYRRYAGPPADIDWNRPYVRRFTKGQTQHIYIGTPGGVAQPALGAALAAAIATRLPPAPI